MHPVFLKLNQIHFPPMALVSILHRITGVILVIAMPVLVYLLTVSLQNEAGYQRAIELSNQLLFKALLILFFWSLGHHVVAGIRFLIIDLLGRPVSGRESAYVALVLSLLVFLFSVGVVIL